MKRNTTIAAIAIVAGLTLSGCGITGAGTDAGSDTKSSHLPSDMKRENKGTTRKGG